MKELLLIPLLLFSIISQSQTSTISWSQTVCTTKDKNGKTIVVNCDDFMPTAIFYGNVDSLCFEMEKRFIQTLNQWRQSNGLNQLIVDYEMQRNLSDPHNLWQVKVGDIDHDEGNVSYSKRTDDKGYFYVGECVAYNSRSDSKGVSEFFLQYKNSKPHWAILTSKEFKYISVSVMYDKSKNRYYSTVNVRR
jgi:uncharacterized protein YkwD